MSYILVTAGPCGSGKSSTGEKLSQVLGVPFIEGDEVHSPENREKMAKGIPLTDDDRWGWLKSIAKIGCEKLTVSKVTKGEVKYSVIGCSSLKKVYRDLIDREVKQRSPSTKVIFLFINISIADSKARVTARKNHYMKANMVDSQFEILETPKDQELIISGGKVTDFAEANSIVIDPTGLSKEQVFKEVYDSLLFANIITPSS